MIKKISITTNEKIVESYIIHVPQSRKTKAPRTKEIRKKYRRLIQNIV